MTDWAGRLKEFASRRLTVVCLPDFFVDHFVELPPLERTLAELRAIHDRGGGSWVGVRQRYLPGGNAGNMARALARLGARVHLLARTDAFGLAFAHSTLGVDGVDLSGVRGDGRLGTTVALEFQPGPRNVMLNEPGAVEDFAPGDLTEANRALIESADAVFVGNWAQARSHGTELARAVLGWARRGHALTFLDASDPSGRLPEVPRLVDEVLASPDLDVLGVNENELRRFGGEGDPLDVGARFAKSLAATLDVHTESFAATWGPNGTGRSPTFKIEARRMTGAGDAWNAGDLVGHLLALEPSDRLRLANAVAAIYLSSDSGQPPTAATVASWLRARPR